jgi:hypothetical protein
VVLSCSASAAVASSFFFFFCCITELLQCKSVPGRAQVSMRPCLQKYISHPSLIIYFSFFFFPQNPIELFQCKSIPSGVCSGQYVTLPGCKKLFLTSKFSYFTCFFGIFFPSPTPSIDLLQCKKATPLSVCDYHQAAKKHVSHIQV